ncbi:MAG TPA: glycosyltransferase family 39 protein [Patescibacteria group bacterium]|nr:glycosyltransferase family 39 protein [Patescibacteria group bacterium]
MKKKVKKTKISKKENKLLNLFNKVWKDKVLVAVIILFVIELFLRCYQIDIKNPFGYDQVDNAWAAKNIIVNHRYPLVGMVAKTNSGIYIGPAYYYLISVLYFVFNLNPVASAVMAILTSIFTFWSIYFVFKKIFNQGIALIGLIINTFALPAIIFDRIQWPVDFIPGLSLLIFYFLYRVIQGKPKNIIYLALSIGFFFNIHFTAIFAPIVVILSLPLFPRTKETLKYILIGIPLFFVWIVPNIIYTITSKTSSSNASYIDTYYHGFHLRRMMQIIGDAFIQFDPYVFFDWIKKIKPFFPILFLIVYLKRETGRDKFKFLYLVFLWFMVPWIIFTVYSGEMSDYYFAFNRFIALMIIAYILYSVFIQNLLTKIGISIFLVIFCVLNLINFLPYKDVGLKKRYEENVMPAVSANRRIEFQVGVPESYLYYYKMRELKGVEDVYK